MGGTSGTSRAAIVFPPLWLMGAGINPLPGREENWLLLQRGTSDLPPDLCSSSDCGRVRLVEVPLIFHCLTNYSLPLRRFEPLPHLWRSPAECVTASRSLCEDLAVPAITATPESSPSLSSMAPTPPCSRAAVRVFSRILGLLVSRLFGHRDFQEQRVLRQPLLRLRTGSGERRDGRSANSERKPNIVRCE